MIRFTTRRLATLLALVVLMLAPGDVRAQNAVDDALGTMTRDEALREAQRLGIDLSNPAEAIRRAQNMGISESRIRQIMQSYGGGDLVNGLGAQSQNQTGQATGMTDEARPLTASEARMEAQRLGIDLSDPASARRRARDLGIPTSRIEALLTAVQGRTRRGETELPELPGTLLTRLPEIEPATVDTEEDGATLVSVRITAGPGGPVPDTMATGRADSVRGGTPSRSSARQDTTSATTPQPQGRSSVSRQQMDLYFVSQSGEDTLFSQRTQRVYAGSREEIWMGSILVTPETEPGTWTLVLETYGPNDEPTSRLKPAGFLTVEGERVIALEHFGYSIFEEGAQSDEGQRTGPVSGAYVVGPEDELRLTVWGAAEFQHLLRVDPEGRVYIPNVGQMTVAGQRLDDLRETMRNFLSRRYAGLTGEAPTIQMDVSVTRMRPLQVFVLGEVEMPGSYTVPSGSSVFSALYEVGGPLERGSLRNVRVVRDQQVAEVDLYDYLLRGYARTSVPLATGDNIFVPPRENTVSIEGAVRRPAIYELREGETLNDLITYAGGLTADADVRRFQVERIIPFRERQDPSQVYTVMDMDLRGALVGQDSVRLEDGDKVEIFSVPRSNDLTALRQMPAVRVAGAVLNPGRYQMGPSTQTVRDLLEQAGGLTGDAFVQRAELVRLREDLEYEVVNVNVEQALDDEPLHNLVLRPQDSLYVFSNRMMRDDRSVSVAGKVRNPGTYRYLEGMTVIDLLLQAGGLYDPEFREDVFLGRADLFRQSEDGSSERIIPFDLQAALDGEGFSDEVLRPEDEIRIYAAEVREIRDRFVTISGAVREPGTYDYQEGMTLEDLVLQAGGFIEDAKRDDIEITRAGESGVGEELVMTIQADFNPDAAFAAGPFSGVSYLAARDSMDLTDFDGGFALQHLDRVYVRAQPNFFESQKTVRVHGEVRYPGEYTLIRPNETLSSVIQRAGGVLPSGYAQGGRLEREGNRVAVNMERALRGHDASDIILQNGDEITIPPLPHNVAVLGNVGQESHIRYAPGERADYYVDRAGGLREGTIAVLLTQPSGETYKLDVRERWGRLSLRDNPVVEDGATLRVIIEPMPQMADEANEGFEWGSTLQRVLGVASSVLTIIILTKRVN